MINSNVLNDNDEQKKPQIIRFNKSDYSEDIGNVLEGNIDTENDELEFDDLTTLTTESRIAIKNFHGTDIHLDGLNKLNHEDAELLAGIQCKYLWLNGVENIDGPTAAALAKSKCDNLLLGGLTSLNKDVSKALSNFEGDILFLDGVESLDENAVEEILKSKCRCIYLVGLKNISHEMKAKLMSFKGTMRL